MPLISTTKGSLTTHEGLVVGKDKKVRPRDRGSSQEYHFYVLLQDIPAPLYFSFGPFMMQYGCSFVATSDHPSLLVQTNLKYRYG